MSYSYWLKTIIYCRVKTVPTLYTFINRYIIFINYVNYKVEIILNFFGFYFIIQVLSNIRKIYTNRREADGILLYYNLVYHIIFSYYACNRPSKIPRVRFTRVKYNYNYNIGTSTINVSWHYHRWFCTLNTSLKYMHNQCIF